MKYINKQNQPNKLTKWIEDKAIAKYTNLPPKMKKFIRKQLLEDQGYLCCYCQKRIDGKKIAGQVRTEIEHIKPQSKCSDIETVQYINLLVSCDGNQQKINKNIRDEDRHCNNYRQDKDLHINLLDVTCENFIYYDMLGNIYAKDEISNIHTTIDNLNLQILKSNRKAYIDGFFIVNSISNLTQQKLSNHINNFSNKSDIDNDGIDKYYEYSGVMINLFKQLGGI